MRLLLSFLACFTVFAFFGSSAQASDVTLPARGCFVYEWYPETPTVGGHSIHYHPVLGEYNSNNQAVIDKHNQWLRIGKCRVGIFSWWGPGTHNEQHRFPLTLNRAAVLGGGFVNWTAYYECEGNITASCAGKGPDPSVAQLDADLDYLYTYAQHSKWAHVNGKPVLFVYSSNETDGCGMAQRWRDANQGRFYLNLKLFSGFTLCTAQPDAWHQYEPSTAYQQHAGHYTAISPGFYKADEQTPRLPRDLIRWRQNIRDMVAANNPWQLVTTFNEWGEGTAVENATEWDTPACPLCQGKYVDELAKDGMVRANKKIAFWIGLRPFLNATDADLNKLADRGVGAVMLQGRHLYRLGGTQRYTGEPGSVANFETGAEWETQRLIRDTKIVSRSKARGIKIYFGWYVVNYHKNTTPYGDWFSDTDWAHVLSAVEGIAGMAKLYGALGVGIDNEDYVGVNSSHLTWKWDYPGRTQPEAVVRAKAKQRGGQLADAVLGKFPGAKMVAYDTQFPGSFDEAARTELNARKSPPQPPNDKRIYVEGDFWQGMLSRTGWGKMDFWDAWFYKAIQRPGWHDWNVAVADGRKRSDDYWRVHAPSLLPRIGYTNFTWIDPGPSASSAFDDAKPPATVKAQLTAARDRGTADYLPVYAYHGIIPVDGPFDYAPYLSAMRDVTAGR
jgi:hypothetical protein